MGYHLSFPRIPLSLLATGAALCLCFVALGCGSSESSGEEQRLEREDAREAREEQESRAAERELKAGDFVKCGAQTFANKRSLCTFAKNVQNAYYVEVVAGSGKAIGFHPPAGQDYRVLCSGTVPHKCTGFKDDAPGIESLRGGVIFFSP